MEVSFQRRIFFACVLRTDNRIFPVAMRLGDTPVPIPNTMVKTQAADGTMLETAWESRWLPESKKKKWKRFLYKDRHSLAGKGG